MTTIKWLAEEHKDFIRKQLKIAEQTLLPSSNEDEELVRRAVFAVRNKSIVFERYISRVEMLYVTVQDVRPAMVEVNFLNKTIACSCPQKQMCRHKLAVLLSMYQYSGSVQDWAAKWRAEKTMPLKNLANERTPDSWVQMTNDVLGRMLEPNEKIQAFTLSLVRDDAMSKLMRFMPFEREWQPLFKLFLEVTLLNQIWQHINKTKSDINSGYFVQFIERSYERIAEAVAELSGQSRLFAADPFYDALQNMVRTLVMERHGEFAKRLDIYRIFWEKLLYEKARREQELALIEAMMAKKLETTPQLSISNDVDLLAIRTVFNILLSQQEPLTEVAEQMVPKSVAYYYELALFAKRLGETWATERLARYILPHLKSYLNVWLNPIKRMDFVRDFHTLFNSIQLSMEDELALYGAMGKFGLQPFSIYLIQNKRFTEWAALHQQNPSSISYLEICGLKDVQEMQPATVLPLLHIYAMDEVRGRSRMNYKQAVRIWKRMKTAAKKAGKTAFFEKYIETIRNQNKRLRALLEEIEKGNLLT